MLKEINNYFYNEFINHEGVFRSDERLLPEDFKNIYPLSNEAIYYHNYSEIDKVYFSGLKNLLGYNDKSLTLEQLFDMTHPDDLPDVFRAIKKAINFFPDHSLTYENAYCIFTYRLKHKTGKYITVLKNTRALNLYKGKIGAHVNQVSDISYLNLPNKVKAWCGINNETYPLLTNKFQKLFTRREKEILHLLVYGKTSEEIASYFNIEKSTVDKHRQNLLFKANVENTMQLLAFCIDNELISLPLS
jgi:DNA-binding CsgD family transcriptional regulator